MTNDRREKRLAQLIEEYGGESAYDEPERRSLRRWALLEVDIGPDDHGGPGWTFADDWKEFLKCAAERAHPEESQAAGLFDLDTQWYTEIEMKVLYEPAVTPDA